MSERILLAYSGTLAASAAAAWIAERHGAEVVTVTLDIGQADDLDEVRARALSCGAVRAHVLDRRDAFASDCVIPALRDSAELPLATLAHPLIARALVEIAAVEAATAVAHASSSPLLDAAIAAVDPTRRIVAPARAWGLSPEALRDYARVRHLPPGPTREPHLLFRPAVEPERAPDTAATLIVGFARGVPVSINGVTMALQELIESLSLIGGQHGIGRHAGQTTVPASVQATASREALSTPAATIVRAAYAVAAGPDGTAHLTLHKGVCTPQGAPIPELVKHS